MKTRILLPAAFAMLLGGAKADLQLDPDASPAPARTTSTSTTSSTVTPAPAAALAISPADARIAALAQRFAQGKSVEAQGNLAQALQIFDSIIADAPDAKGSLQEAGGICLRLGNYLKADDYFSKLHALVPDYPGAIEGLIQADQSLKRDAKVEILLKELKDLAAKGKTKEPYFIRERIALNGGIDIVIYQFFDYRQPRYYAWAADVLDSQHHLKRRLTVNYDPEVTAQMRNDPKLANAEQFLVVDNVMDAQGHIVKLDVYQQFLSLPEYAKVRMILLEVMANALKPIDSAAVPQAASPQ